MSKSTLGSVPLLSVTRAGVQDNLHRGSIAVVDDSGKIVLAIGDPMMRAYIRSAAKLMQALPMMLSGAPEKFGFDDADIAIICGSHLGGPAQIAQVRSILAKAGVPEEALQSGAGIADNCSGKHSGKLAACAHQSLDLATYLHPDHPHQKKITDTIAKICSVAPAEIRIGVDGCGAPIHYLPLFNMALGFARMSRPDQHFDPRHAAAISRITRAMAANPGGHTGEPEYLQTLGDLRFLSKAGGNGVYCAGVVGRGLGFALKVEDGSSLPIKPVFIEIMRRLGVLTAVEAKTLAELFIPKVANRRGTVVGELNLLI